MKHARNDYNRIQDPSGKIPADEPVFLLRGQDLSAPQTLRFWAEVNGLCGGDPEASALARQWADKMEEWQSEHAAKPADLPSGSSHPVQQQEQDERAMFMQAFPHHKFMRAPDGYYAYVETQAAWDAWQARAALDKKGQQ